MNKVDLISTLAAKEKIQLRVAKVVVDLVFNGMKEALEKGDRVELRGFGSFAVRNYRSYKGRNPKTGKIVEVAAKRAPFFRVGKELKEIVNG